MKERCAILVAGILAVCGTELCGGISYFTESPEALIGKLTEVSEPGYGYSATFSGAQFLPQSDSAEVHTLILGSQQPVKSRILDAIVRQGIKAVPVLLKHMDDDRMTKIPPVKGLMWMSFADEYDFNRRVRTQSPEGVNRDTFGDDHPSSHTITVGDLCFVALGQILNRNFCATRYQPTGGVVVSSPTYSRRLCAVVRADWQGLTEKRHREMLMRDFLKPDHESRRIGAYRRLAFYYPDSVESLVLRQLTIPVFNVFDVNRFMRERLYPEKSSVMRKMLFDNFVKRNGVAASDGVLLQLFRDLEMQAADEAGRLHPPLKEKYDARSLLILLYGYPNDVESTKVPFVDTWSESDRAQFIEALVHDHSRKVGDAVMRIFLENPKDDYLAPASLRCLASRGYAPFLVKQLDTIDVASVVPDPLCLECIKAISISKEAVVQQELLKILQTTRSPAYFMAALAGAAQPDKRELLRSARKLLAGLPEDTDQGEALLRLIRQRYPDEAVDIFRDFLKTGSARRAETLCRVLWYGDPLSKEILAPLLDDKRELRGFTTPMRVCDRAAQAISHTTDKIGFNCEWDIARKDEVISRLKMFCEQSGHRQATSQSILRGAMHPGVIPGSRIERESCLELTERKNP